MSRLLFLFCFSGERIVLFEESREIYIPKAISLAKVALRLIERISNVKTERGNKDVVTILIEGENQTNLPTPFSSREQIIISNHFS